MDPHFWPKIEELFERAMQLPTGQRAEFVNSQTTDPQVRREVVSLLDHAARADAFLEPNDESNVRRALTDVARDLDWNARPVRFDSPEADTNQADLRESKVEQTRELAERLRREFSGRLPQYELKGLLGSGGEAAIFSAMDKQLGRLVAVRVLFVSGADDRNRERIVRESRALSRIHNEHVVTIYSVHVDGELSLLISELVDGPTLKELLVTRGALHPRVAADLARQAALGVSAAHQHSVVHGDIKPRNILLTAGTGHESGYLAKISDFGFAAEERELQEPGELAGSGTSETASPSRSGSTLSGTLPYVCPERLDASGSSGPQTAADIYALGVTLYEALTGQLPFRGARHMIVRQIVAGNPVYPRRLDDRIPEDLENICLRAMAREPSVRYPTAALLAEDLRRFLDGQQTSVRPASAFRRFRSFATRNWQSILFGAVTAALLIVLVVGASMALMSNRDRQNEIRSMQGTLADVQASELLMADHGMLKFAISKMDKLDQATREKIRQVSNDPAAEAYQRLNAAIVRLHLGEDVLPEIVRLLPEVSVRPALMQLLLAAPENVGDSGRQIGQLASAQQDIGFRTQLAMLAWAFGDSEGLKAICNDRERPDSRTAATMLVSNWHPVMEEFVERVRNESDPQIQYCMIAGAGRMDPRSLHRYDVRLLEGLLGELSGESSSAGVRAASVWSAGKLGLDRPDGPLSQVRQGKDWETTESGITLVRVPAGTARLGALDPRIEGDFNQPHDVTLTRDYWIASTETPVALYRQFLNDPDREPAGKPVGSGDWQPDIPTSPTENHPATRVSWIDAVLFCNWLSEREGLTPCFRFAEGEETESGDPRHPALTVQTDFSANGYRLPTEAESEFASRAGSQSNHWFGNELNWMNELVATSSLWNVAARPCGDLMPNPFGIHELEGNVWEWCLDWYEPIGQSAQTDPAGPDSPNPQFGVRKAYRGGGVNTQRGSAEVSARGHDDPSVRWANLGFRVVRMKTGGAEKD